MKGIRAGLIAIIVLATAGAAAAGPQVLTRSGDLYSAAVDHNQVVITALRADGTAEDLTIPQSGGAIESSLQLGVDASSGALYALWQRWTGMDARIRFATYVDGTWLGPTTIAGNDGTAALNPQMVIHSATSTYMVDGEVEGEALTEEVTTPFVHIAWWSQVSEDLPGTAHYASIPVAESGVPQLELLEEHILSGLRPYGTACQQIQSTESLNHPKLFIDPQTGNPHIFLVDYEDCAFQILELAPELIEDTDDSTATIKRRRQIIILRHRSTVGIRVDLALPTAKFEVGAGLSIVAYWDREDDAINYLQMNHEGISDTKTLVLSEALDHEKAVELIRGLAD